MFSFEVYMCIALNLGNYRVLKLYFTFCYFKYALPTISYLVTIIA